jgi:YNFM family putative membrane transporter
VTLWSAVAVLGLPLLLSPHLQAVLTGMVVIAIGTFFAQATAKGFLGHAAVRDRGAASGTYLASYFSGGLVGSTVLGQLFDRFGWTACVAGITVALAVAAVLAIYLKMPIVRLQSGETP